LSSKLPPYQAPSPFTPFLRRFTDERARDLSETIALYNEVRTAYSASPWSQEDAIERVNGVVVEWIGKEIDLPESLGILKSLDSCQKAVWPAPSSEDTELGVLMEPEVRHGASEVYAGVQA
jgi:hypothetical protein